MNILKDWNAIGSAGFDCIHYGDVTFKDDFFIMLKKLIDETNNGKLNLFKKEITSDEVIELLKKAQDQQLSDTSQCHVFAYKEHITIYIYEQFMDEYNPDTYQYKILSEPEYIYIYFNLTNPNLPFVYLKTN